MLPFFDFMLHLSGKYVRMRAKGGGMLEAVQGVPLGLAEGGMLRLNFCGFETCAPGHSFGPAVRDHFLIHCILSGQGVFQAEGKTYPLEAGQGFLILPGQVTCYTADSEQPWRYCWAGFSGSEAPRWMDYCGLSIFQPICCFGSIPEMEDCVRRMERNEQSVCSPLISLARLCDFLALLHSEQGPRPVRPVFETAADYMAQNYSYPLAIEQVAGYAGVSRSHLFRIFKRETGLSPQEYLLQIRLNRAAELLKKPGLRVMEAMYSCGFSDPAHFSRQFKRRFGAPPSVYRKEHERERNGGK